jgi:hypothetical protein
MTLIIEIALGIVLGFILLNIILSFAEVLIKSAILIFLVVFLGAVGFFAYYSLSDIVTTHLVDIKDIGLGIFYIVLAVLGFAVAAFFVGLIAERFPLLNRMSSSNLISLSHVLSQTERNTKSDIYLDYIEQRIRLGFIAALIFGMLFLLGLLVDKLTIQSDYGGFIGASTALLIIYLMGKRKTPKMSHSDIVDQIKKRKKLGYETSDLEEKLND